MIKKLTYNIWIFNREILFRKKIKKIAALCSFTDLDQKLIKKYKSLWKPLSKNPSVKYLKAYSSISRNESYTFVPENIYYNKIELRLNNKAYASAYSDKNFYEAYLPEKKEVFPKTFLRCINGQFFNQSFELESLADFWKNFVTRESSRVIKPSVETSGGANFSIIETRKGKVFLDEKEVNLNQFEAILDVNYANGFVLQEKIRQHPWFAGFNPSSVNTVRMFTYRSVADNQIHILHAVIRFGKPGSLVDNQAAGGFSCGINAEGKLNDFAVDKLGKRYESIEWINQNKGQWVPGLEEMKSIARSIAPRYHYHRLLGFDFCYTDEDKVKLLEINCKNIETNFLQMNNGPLFGSFTDEIIEYCTKTKPTVVFDFQV